MTEKSFDRAQQPNAADLDDETRALVRELFDLVRAGDAARLENLLEMGLVPNLCDAKGNSLLMLASYNGQFETARVILEHGGDPQIANERGQIPLAGAAFKGDAAMARLLLDHNAEVDAAGGDGKTALMFAAMFDRVEIIELLLARNADAARRSSDGMTALDYARAMNAHNAAARLEQEIGGAAESQTN